jgi:hypothetical protein
MSPVRYDLGFYIPENGVIHSQRREKPQALHNINWLDSVAEM